MIKIIAKSKPSRDHQVVLPKNMIIVSREAPRGMCLCVSKTTPVGFEPTRGDPIGLAGRRLNRSAKVSVGSTFVGNAAHTDNFSW